MKMILLKQVITMSKYTLYGIFIQALLCGVLLANNGHAQRESVFDVYLTLKAEQVPLKSVLKQLEKKSNFNFTFNNEFVDLNQPVSLNYDQTSLGTILGDLSVQVGLQFLRVNQNIHVSPKKGGPGVQEANEFPKSLQQTVSGTVTADDDGLPLPGVSILIKGSTTGTTTDANGRYSLQVPQGATLRFSYIGYTTEEVVVGQQTTINVSLKANLGQLDEVVVVGYGTQERRELSTSISSISAKSITEQPVADPAQALQGRVAGVVVVQNSGAPGGTGGTSIRIRGISSITGTNNPLIVLDGFPLPDQGADNVLNSLSPHEIESIDVLKDAAATAIYGVRASNGVVVITTKRGKAGTSSLNVDIQRGIQQAWRLPELLNAREYATINSEARIAGGDLPLAKLRNLDAIEQEYGEGTRWLDEVFRVAAIQNVALTASGGNEKAQYAFSAGYFQQDGIIRNTDFERFNMRFNGNVNVGSRLKVGNSLTLSRTVERPTDTFSPFNSVILLALTSPPTVRPFNPDGSFAGGIGSIDGFDEPNPVYQLEVPQITNTRFRAITTAFAELELAKGLTMKGNFGVDFLMQNIRVFNPAIPSTGGRPIQITGVTEQTNFNPSYLAEFTLNYQKTFGEHKVNALAGYMVQDNQFNFLGAGRSGYTRIDLPVLSDAAHVPRNLAEIFNFGGFGESRLLSYVSRVNYDFKSRYFLSVTVRRDGSSNFGPGNRFATFPAFSAAWRIGDEDFMSGVPLISDLKLRASYGFTGNQNVAPFAFLARINTGIQYPLGDNSASGGANAGAAPTATPNPNLQWERNGQANVGFDLGLFNNRVEVAFDAYVRRSIDLIFNVPPPDVSGTFEAVPFNTGTMENRGIDLGINTVNIDKNGFRWNTNFTISAFRNEVTDLGLGAPINLDFARIQGGSRRVEAGFPAFYFFGFQTAGIFQTQEEVNAHARQTGGTDPGTSTAPGDIRFVDVNNDGIINDQDRTNLGNSFPNFNYGITNNFSWKNFDLSIFLLGSQGNKVLNFNRWYTESGVSNGNFGREVLNRWTGPGTSNDMPRMILNDPNGNNRVSDRFVEDASFLRIKNVRLGYNLPKVLTEKVSVKRLQIYGNVQNLATFTRYTGFDPEVGGGVDIGFYPQPRTFMLGITADF
jgi:TonB-linked SusC/RagA family outer membrane protein